jgi:outer membrane protein OmpA-like peptidoglycan-associated protein
MLDDILETAELGWEDIKVVWAKDLTASDNSPAALFRKNPNIDACFVITPDMAGLCGGLDTVGRNVEGQVEGSHVVISTADLSQSIADVYVCRKDFFEANRDLVTRFVTGYLKACEEVGKLRADYEAKKPAPKYKELLELTQTIYGKETIPSLDDAHGLLCDCDMVIWPGNVKFFTWGEGNLRGFEVFHKRALELAVALKYATKKVSLAKAEFDYQSDAFKKDLENTKLENPTPVEVTPDQLRAAIKAEASSGPKVIVSFEINFDVGRDDFPARRYGENFLKVVTESARWAGAAFVIRGHTDPTKAIHDLALAGVKKGLIQERRKTDGTVEYLYGGKPLDQAVVKEIMRLVQEGRFEGTVDEKGMPISPLATVQAANNLSLERAQAVRAAILRYANDRGYRLNEMQLQPTGAGIAEPLVPVPTTDADAAKNRRVQFLLITVPAEEAVSPGK